MIEEIQKEEPEQMPKWWQWFEHHGDGLVGRTLLAIFAILDSIIIFFPPEIMIAALTLAKPRKWIFYTLFATLFTTIGAVITYILGAYFFDMFGSTILSLVGGEAAFLEVQTFFDSNLIAGILFVGVTPIPWVPFLLAAGAFKANFGVFLIGVVLARIIRFGVTAFLVATFGQKGLSMVLKTLRYMGTAGIVIAGVAAIILAWVFVQFVL
jgi:membrane protein YqaA with SNARE-associated domain